MSHNIKYDDIQDIVEYLVRTKSRNYAFDCFGADDIGQEIRIICLNALPKLKPDEQPRDKWVNFFGRCVDNGLKNLKRDRYVRTSFADKKKYEQLEEEDESGNAQELRRKWQKHQRNIQKKLAIKHTVPLDGLADFIKNDKFEHEMEYKDLEKHLIEQANDDIVIPLSLMLAGRAKEVSRKEKRRVQAFVKKILD
ncbi:hypothetical protein E4G67_04045 [Candidatus Bathyarchaeota archaeon]|nr:MAG: hypothetical protein E4G67_04045 [Candidatus Bathyarchaeota archaeon]